MRSLILLLAAVCALVGAEDALSRTRRGAGWSFTYEHARTMGQEMQIEQLSHKLDELEAALGDDHHEEVHDKIHDLESRLDHVEGR
jgi:uncharacterized membrane protein